MEGTSKSHPVQASGDVQSQWNIPATLEVSDGSGAEDADSALGYSLRDSTTSLRTSIYDFVQENGRTYHAYRSGKYMLPNDGIEQERLDLQHHSFKIYLDGRLHMAPLADPRRVLDIGTGTGIWAVEFANEYPGATVIGTDLSPIQPEVVPRNVSFEIGDAEEADWGFDTPFDYIHGRAMVTCFGGGGGGEGEGGPGEGQQQRGGARAVLATALDNLAPGGWFELQDPCLPMRCDDGTMEGTALAEWNRLMCEGMLRVGKDLRDSLRWGGHMRELGFEDVTETRGAVAFNTWPKGRKNKLLGALCCQNLSDGVQSMSLALFTRVLGMESQRVLDFLEDVKRDLANPGIHAYSVICIVYGRKPLEHGEQEEGGVEANMETGR